VQHIRHPELSGLAEGKAAPVNATIRALDVALVQSVANEQAVYGGLRQRTAGVDAGLCAHKGYALTDRARRIRLLEFE